MTRDKSPTTERTSEPPAPASQQNASATPHERLPQAAETARRIVEGQDP